MSGVSGPTAGVSGQGVTSDQEEGGVAPVRTFRHHTVAGVFVGAAAAALAAIGVAYAVVRRRMVAARRGAGADADMPKSNV